MSKTQPVSDGDVETTPRTKPANPFKNPSYPQRVHASERPHWLSVVKDCEERLAAAAKQLSVLGQGPNRAAFERLYAQMQGARDQVADAARRLPGETGDLYEEDRHRLEEGVAALERVFKRWETQTAGR